MYTQLLKPKWLLIINNSYCVTSVNREQLVIMFKHESCPVGTQYE